MVAETRRPKPLISPLGSSVARSPTASSAASPAAPAAASAQVPLRGGKASPSAKPKGKDTAASIDPSLLDVSIIKVECPGKDIKPMAVWLDLEEQCLNMQEASLAPDTRKVTFGGCVTVDFDEIVDVSVSAGALQIGGAGGTMARLHLETTEELQMWIRGLRAALDSSAGNGSAPAQAARRSPGAGRGTGGAQASPAAAGGAPKMELLEAMKALIAEQEGRIAHLEELRKCKDEHLLKLHDQLENSLSVLQSGQKMYAEQHKIMEAQKESITALTEALRTGKLPSAQPSPKGASADRKASSPQPRAAAAFKVAAAAAAQMQQAQAASAARAAAPTSPARTAAATSATSAGWTQVPVQEDDEDDGSTDLPPQMAELMRRTEGLQRAVEEAMDGCADPASAGPPPEIMAKLGALIQEKNELEAQLLREQADLEDQLRTIQTTRQ